jgi:hypothetical protein
MRPLAIHEVGHGRMICVRRRRGDPADERNHLRSLSVEQNKGNPTKGAIVKRASFILAASCLVTGLLQAGPLPQASAITIAPPCYKASKLCVAAFQIPGDDHWQLVIGGPKRLYLSRYGLCVTAPDGSHACDTFRIPSPKGRTFFFKMVTWERHFPNDGPGRYVAHWRRPPNHRLIGQRSFTVR